MKKLGLCALILLFLFCGTNAFAVSYGFSDISLDDDIDISKNFKVEITQVGDEVVIKVENNGSDQSAISAVYFRDVSGLISGLMFDEDSSNTKKVEVKFEDDTSTPDEYYFYKKTGNDKYMVDAGETAFFRATVIAGRDFNTVADALAGMIAIGVIDKGSGGGGNEPYIASITSTPTPTPEPATMLLLGAGLIGIAGMGRKKLFKKK